MGRSRQTVNQAIARATDTLLSSLTIVSHGEPGRITFGARRRNGVRTTDDRPEPIGVVALSWLAVRSGVPSRPESLSRPFLTAGAFLTGIGFTMALFIAGLAYSPAMLDSAKTGILGGSIVSAAAGLSALVWLSRKKQQRQ